MAESQDASIKLLREWAPLTDLFNKLPTKVQTGIFSQEIKLTCLDVLPEFLALGTNVGIVYWFDRIKKDLQRLRCENSNIPITCVKVLSTVDYMVACGNNIGNISIFQIPKSHPENIPENLKPKPKQVERYTVTELHKAPISAIEWAKNGMKLFSGDQNGSVVLTEIDYYMHICKSLEILNESYEVVQLSYNQQFLLVSTTYRSIICQNQDKWKVCQVGKKDRKVLGKFGGVIYQTGYKTSDSSLYCTRPGLRIWISDIEGNVQKTLLFKDLLCKECSEVPLINPISRNLRKLKPQKEPSFGMLLSFNEKLLVTHNNDVVYILDPHQMSILSTISHLRSILCVATYKDEIFILEEERSLIRISYKPESFSAPNFSPISSTFLPITSIKDMTSKLQSSSIISAIPPILDNIPFTSNEFNIHTDETLVMNAEEATESPVKIRNVVNLDDTQKRFDSIGKQEFEDKILFRKSHTKKRSKNGLMSLSTNSLSSNSSEEKDLSYTRPTIMNLSTVGVLPDLRSPESIKNDIEYKEKILAGVLSFDKVKISDDTIGENSKEPTNKAQISGSRESIKFGLENDVKVKHMKNKGDSSDAKKDINGKTYSLDTDKKLVPKFNFFKSKNKQQTIDKPRSSTPVVHIPNEWKLSSIQIEEGDKTEVTDKTTVGSADISLSDWEII